MSYETILVHLDESARCEARIALAAQLALGHRSHLIGVAPTGWVALPGPTSVLGASASDYVEHTQAYLSRRARTVVDDFEAHVEPLGLRSYEGRLDEQDAAASMVEWGRCADLVVLGQTDRSGSGSGGTLVPDFPQQVLMQVGRPLLVVPYAGRFEQVGRNVLVAWNDTRETARALADALPLLSKAQSVHLYGFERTGGGERFDARHFEGAHTRLARHDVECKGTRSIAATDVGNALLSTAADLGADLIVMGGYGHARIAELVMSGVTRTVLAEMTVPVLITH